MPNRQIYFGHLTDSGFALARYEIVKETENTVTLANPLAMNAPLPSLPAMGGHVPEGEVRISKSSIGFYDTLLDAYTDLVRRENARIKELEDALFVANKTRTNLHSRRILLLKN